MESSYKPREMIAQYLTLCHTVLINHFISIAKQGHDTGNSLGIIPYELTEELEFNSIDYEINTKISSPEFISEISPEFISEITPLNTISDDSDLEYGEEAPFSVSSHRPVTTIIFTEDFHEQMPLNISYDSEEVLDLVIDSEKNDIPYDMNRCYGIIKIRPKSPSYFEAAFIETEEFKPKITSNFLRSDLMDKLEALTHFESAAYRGKAAEFISSSNPHVAVLKEVPYEERPQVLYAEVLSHAVSQGGEGFVLNAGDIVTVVQFIKQFDLIEVKWKGMQGLFHSHHFKLLTSKGVSSSVLSRTHMHMVSKVVSSGLISSKRM